MNKVDYEDFKSMGLDYSPLFMKHVEIGNIEMYDYSNSNYEELRKLAKMNRISKDNHNSLLGVRVTDRPLTEEVLYQ